MRFKYVRNEIIVVNNSLCRGRDLYWKHKQGIQFCHLVGVVPMGNSIAIQVVQRRSALIWQGTSLADCAPVQKTLRTTAKLSLTVAFGVSHPISIQLFTLLNDEMHEAEKCATTSSGYTSTHCPTWFYTPTSKSEGFVRRTRHST